MRYEVQQLSDGWDGTDETVDKIISMVADSLTDPVVRLTAENIVRDVPERDKTAEIEKVSRFVRNRIRYTNEGVETLKTPRFMLDEMRAKGKAVGDCDDHLMLWMAMHKVLGQKVRIKVVSQRKDGRASHIYGEVFNPDTKRWIADDTIKKDRRIGWSVPKEKRTAEKTYGEGGDAFHLRGTDMAGYSTFSQNGTWHPGGAARLLMNTRQRPGIGECQLAVGKSLLPSHVRIRGANSLDNEGMGIDFSGFSSGVAKGALAAAEKVAAPPASDIGTGITNALSSLIPATAEAIASAKKKRKIERPEGKVSYTPDFFSQYGLILGIGAAGLAVVWMLTRK